MNNLHGILLMLAAMIGFALEDAFIKTATGNLPVSQVMLILGLGGAVTFALMTRISHGTLAPLVHRDMISPAMLARNISEGLSGVAFITALSLVPLSTVAAVFQATPLAITAGAALFLGEQVGWRRWSAIAVGFVGVLLIIRPGSESFSMITLLPMVAVFGVALRDLLTRQLNPGIPSLAVSFYAYIAITLGGLVMAPLSAPMIRLNAAQSGQMLGAILFGVIGYYAIVRSMRAGETSAIMPFRYSRLVFSLILGVLVFGERPDAMTLLGAGIVIATGVYMFLREGRLARTNS